MLRSWRSAGSGEPDLYVPPARVFGLSSHLGLVRFCCVGEGRVCFFSRHSSTEAGGIDFRLQGAHSGVVGKRVVRSWKNLCIHRVASWSAQAAAWLWFRNQLRSLSSCRVYAQVSLGRADTADSASTVARPTTKSAKELRVKWQQKEFSAFWADHVGIRVSGLKLSDPGQELVSSDCPATRNHKTPPPPQKKKKKKRKNSRSQTRHP